MNAYYDELKQKGAGFEQQLMMQAWGSRDFLLQDPFGNRITVVERTEV